MNYWLDLFTPFTWTRFRNHGADISGFRHRQRKAAFERVKKGDLLLCYLVKLSRWCGVLEVTSEAFEDRSPIFADTEDPFIIRFHVKPRTLWTSKGPFQSSSQSFGTIFPLPAIYRSGHLAGPSKRGCGSLLSNLLKKTVMSFQTP